MSKKMNDKNICSLCNSNIIKNEYETNNEGMIIVKNESNDSDEYLYADLPDEMYNDKIYKIPENYWLKISKEWSNIVEELSYNTPYKNKYIIDQFNKNNECKIGTFCEDCFKNLLDKGLFEETLGVNCIECGFFVKHRHRAIFYRYASPSFSANQPTSIDAVIINGELYDGFYSGFGYDVYKFNGDHPIKGSYCPACFENLKESKQIELVRTID